MVAKTIKDDLLSHLHKAFQYCGYPVTEGEVFVCKNFQPGQFQYSGALSLANRLNLNPRDIARNVIDAIKNREMFKNIFVSGPGFIVMTLSDEFIKHRLDTMSADPRLGIDSVATPKRVIIDFGGPNVAKPLHVGHLRSTVIGDCTQRLFRFMGDEVQSDIHLGDWGLPMGMLITELEKQQPHLPYFNGSPHNDFPTQSPVTIFDLETMYPAASARCYEHKEDMALAQKATADLQNKHRGYTALWRHFVSVSQKDLKNDFNSLGVYFDLWNGESRYHERIPMMIRRLEKRGLAQKSKGALVLHVARKTDKKPMPPFLLLKSDGSYLYSTTDLACLDERLRDLDADLILYVVDQRQHLHFESLFRAASVAGFKNDIRLEHIGFGTVNGKDGKPFRTRDGKVYKLKKLIADVRQRVRDRMQDADMIKSYTDSEQEAIVEKVAVAALKFADLMNHRMSNYIFDIDKFTRFEGKTGPYCLYSAVRIKSIIQEATDRNILPGPWIGSASKVEDALRFQMLLLPDAVYKAYSQREPHHLCNFASGLAKAYSRFYKKHHILNEPSSMQQSTWLSESWLCAQQLSLVLGLLGIDIPERM